MLRFYVTKDAGSTRVLLVDDEESISSVLALALRSMDFVVETARDAETAVVRLERDEFDVLVVDMILPGMDGVALTRAVHASHPGTKVIVLTGAPSDDNYRETMSAGAFAYLAKPIRLLHLTEEIKRAAAKTT
jgi:DNA-binding NtrC family response regulator